MGEITAFFRERLEYAVGHGIARDLLILDPGLGFGKTRDHNLEILRRLEVFLDWDVPCWWGPPARPSSAISPAGRRARSGTWAPWPPCWPRCSTAPASSAPIMSPSPGSFLRFGRRFFRPLVFNCVSPVFAFNSKLKTRNSKLIMHFFLNLRWQDLADIILVAVIIYQVVLALRGTQAVQVMAGLFLLFLAYLVARQLEFFTLEWLLDIIVKSFVLMSSFCSRPISGGCEPGGEKGPGPGRGPVPGGG